MRIFFILVKKYDYIDHSRLWHCDWDFQLFCPRHRFDPRVMPLQILDVLNTKTRTLTVGSIYVY